MASTNSVKTRIQVPLPSPRHAKIAYDVLRIDEEPRRSAVTKKLTLAENILEVEITGDCAKTVRVALTAFFEAIILCCDTLEAFGPPALMYQHYK